MTYFPCSINIYFLSTLFVIKWLPGKMCEQRERDISLIYYSERHNVLVFFLYIFFILHVHLLFNKLHNK